MIQLRRSEERGRRDHGWLNARYTFSFADYHDPAHVHFGALRVLNQDRIAPGQGFGRHGHENMEIVTYVLDGVLEHADSMGNSSRILPGEVQLMSAGTGVQHSEFNASSEEELHLLQMWVFPRERGSAPRYEQKEFPASELHGALRLVVSPDGADGSLSIRQDARLYVGRFKEGDEARLALPPGRIAWIHLARGELHLNDVHLGPGDGAGLRNETEVTITGASREEAAELVIWELPS